MARKAAQAVTAAVGSLRVVNIVAVAVRVVAEAAGMGEQGDDAAAR